MHGRNNVVAMRDINISLLILQNLLQHSRKVYEDFLLNSDTWCTNAKEDLVTKPGYFNREVLGKKGLSELLREKLDSCMNGKAFLCCRMGNTECTILGQYLEKCCGYRKRYGDSIREWFLKTSGFFSDDKDDADIDEYSRMMLNAMSLIDIFLVWHPCFMDVVANYLAPQAVLAVNEILDYDTNRISWVSGLTGKKVLVVTSFAKSIQYQYERRDKLAKYPGALLPEFELKTYQMIQTQCNHREGFNSWFDAYKKVENDVLSIDFDVAIVGAGAYAFPLCAAIKRNGRSAIEACSHTPTLFGVIGKRYIEDDTLARCGTKAWIRPMEETPEYANEIEDACYW